MPNVAEVITEHVTLTGDCVDRLYLNAYIPRLQSGGGFAAFKAGTLYVNIHSGANKGGEVRGQLTP